MSGRIWVWKWAQCGQVNEAYSIRVIGALGSPSTWSVGRTASKAVLSGAAATATGVGPAAGGRVPKWTPAAIAATATAPPATINIFRIPSSSPLHLGNHACGESNYYRPTWRKIAAMASGPPGFKYV